MTSFNPTQKLTILKHLAGGKSADLVAVIMKCKPADIIEAAKAHGYPDVEKIKWAVDILEKKLEDDAQPPASAVPAHAPRESFGTRPGTVPAQPSTLPPVARPDEIRILINTAKDHPSKRIQAQGNRIIDAIDKLKDLIHEDQEKNAEKRAAEAAKAAARAEIERLEAQLAAAKAKLRGTPKAKATVASTEKKANTAPRGEYPCRNEGCEEIITTPQGRGLHERQHCAHRPALAAS